jgi:RNA polymerase sigma-70 factor (ECF subfamily)
MAVHYARCSGEDADDLRQEAWLGLLEALPNLDVRIGDPEQYLVRYARWRCSTPCVALACVVATR